MGVFLAHVSGGPGPRGQLRSRDWQRWFLRARQCEQVRGVEPNHAQLRPSVGYRLDTMTPKTVVRAGFGRSYAINSGGANFGTYCCQWPIGNNQAINSTTNYTQIFPLSQGPPPPQNVTAPDSGRLALPPGQMVFARPFDDQDYFSGRLQLHGAASVRIQSLTAEVGYVGALGRHLFRAHEANPAIPGPGALISRKPYGAPLRLQPKHQQRANEGNSHFNSLTGAA